MMSPDARESIITELLTQAGFYPAEGSTAIPRTTAALRQAVTNLERSIEVRAAGHDDIVSPDRDLFQTLRGMVKGRSSEELLSRTRDAARIVTRAHLEAAEKEIPEMRAEALRFAADQLSIGLPDESPSGMGEDGSGGRWSREHHPGGRRVGRRR